MILKRNLNPKKKDLTFDILCDLRKQINYIEFDTEETLEDYIKEYNNKNTQGTEDESKVITLEKILALPMYTLSLIASTNPDEKQQEKLNKINNLISEYNQHRASDHSPDSNLGESVIKGQDRSVEVLDHQSQSKC